MRLQKFLANHGVDSRRKCEEHIKDGRVKVNNKVIREMGFIVDPDQDEVIFDGKKIGTNEKKVYIMLNKPRGVITSVKDNFNRQTVLDLVRLKERVYPVGRLDYDTEGLLLLTNDGDFTYTMTHPKHHIGKTYVAKIKGRPTKAEIKAFENGLIIEDYKTSKASFKVLREFPENTLVEIVIWEGRNRQVRKMCEKIGHPVLSLKRTSIGSLALGDLEIGSYRNLTKNEIKSLGVLNHD